MNCENCAESTRRIVGFWDGRCSGCLYDCNNEICPVWKEKMKKIKNVRLQLANIRMDNVERGIDIEKFRKSRIDAGVLLLEAAKVAGVETSTYSAWESQRKVLPDDMYKHMINYFKGE